MGTTLVQSAKGYKVREAGFEDYEQISALQARYGLGVKDYEDWSQLWLGNPLYRQLQSRWPIGWVLEDTEGRIVASIGNLPLPYEWNGEGIVASSGTSWVAEPAYRGASLVLLDRVVNQPRVDVYLNSTVTKESQPAIEALQCLRVPVGLWDERAFWITNYRGFSASLLRKKSTPAAELLSYPLAAASWLKDRLKRPKALKTSVAIEACTGFDNRFEQFWQELRTRRRDQLLGVRSCEVLNWHFGDPLRKKRLWIGAVSSHGRLAAYAIFDRRDNRKYGLKRVRLMDYQSLDGSDEYLGPLLSWGLERCAKAGVHMLENVGRWLEEGEVIANSAPYRSALYAWSYFYRTDNAHLTGHLQARSAWAPTLFDGNSSV